MPNTKHIIECADSWLAGELLPTYSNVVDALRILYAQARLSDLPSSNRAVTHAADVLGRISFAVLPPEPLPPAQLPTEGAQ